MNERLLLHRDLFSIIHLLSHTHTSDAGAGIVGINGIGSGFGSGSGSGSGLGISDNIGALLEGAIVMKDTVTWESKALRLLDTLLLTEERERERERL